MNERCRKSEKVQNKQYRILTRGSGGWWNHNKMIWAANAEEAVEVFADNAGCNPPNEIAVQSQWNGAHGAFRLFRIVPRSNYEIEAI